MSINYGECEEEFFRFSSNPMQKGDINNKIIVIDSENNNNSNYILSIYDKYGSKVYSKTQKNKLFEVSQLKQGIYFVKFQIETGKVISKTLIIN